MTAVEAETLKPVHAVLAVVHWVHDGSLRSHLVFRFRHLEQLKTLR